MESKPDIEVEIYLVGFGDKAVAAICVDPGA